MSVVWDSYGPLTYVELSKQASPAVIDRSLRGVIRRKSSDAKSEAFLFPMKDWRLHDEFANGRPTGGGRIRQVHMLAAIAWIILLIACINFMNLATASSQKRAREVGVRKVLGSGRRSLVAQFMGEAFFMSVLASVLALLFMALALPSFNLLMQKHLSLDFFSPLHILSLLVIVVVCGLIAGSYPAFYLSSFHPVFVLKGLKVKAGNAAVIRKGLVVFQFTASVIFFVSTVIVYKQIQYVKERNLGFNKENLIEINPQHDISKFFPLIKEELLRSGLIENAAISDHTTLYGGDTDDRFQWEQKSPDNKVSIAHRNVSPEFIPPTGYYGEGSGKNRRSDEGG